MGTRFINHRHARHEVRRVLANLRTRCRDLTKAISFGEIDLQDGACRASANRDAVAVYTKGIADACR
jgi:hypothetical protein